MKFMLQADNRKLLVQFPEIAKRLLPFPKCPHSFWGSNQPTMQWVMWVISPGVRWSVRETGHLLSFRAKVQNERSDNSTTL